MDTLEGLSDKAVDGEAVRMAGAPMATWSWYRLADSGWLRVKSGPGRSKEI
jgi:hypothetical protein